LGRHACALPSNIQSCSNHLFFGLLKFNVISLRSDIELGKIIVIALSTDGNQSTTLPYYFTSFLVFFIQFSRYTASRVASCIKLLSQLPLPQIEAVVAFAVGLFREPCVMVTLQLIRELPPAQLVVGSRWPSPFEHKAQSSL